MKSSARSKALVALAFAGGVLSSPLSGLAQSDTATQTTVPVPVPAESALQHIVNCDQISPESRANHLLALASANLRGDDTSSLERSFQSIKNQPSPSALRNSRAEEREEGLLVGWALALSTGAHRIGESESAADKVPSKEQLALAKDALQQSLLQLDRCTNTFAKMHLYYIASKLFKQLGDTTGTLKCDAYLKSAMQACEKNSQGDQEPVRAAVSVLTLIANEIIPVYIDGQFESYIRFGRPKKVEVKPFTEIEFHESEKLRLRAVAMADRLPPKNHVRRKAHRDLSLWYSTLEKPELAEKEKQTLFELVGIHDDAILQPASGLCGAIIWWQSRSAMWVGGCGMG